MPTVRRWRLPGLVLCAPRGEMLLVAGLLVLALAVRLPYLWDIPRFTDETAEARLALRIARGEILPLTNRDPYIGALWNYLLAGAFAVGGASLFTPRTVVVVFGALTVFPAYLLGRTLGSQSAAPERPIGPIVGVLTALLLALSPAHIVVNSHIAWSNCLTPLFTTLGLWLTSLALARAQPAILPLAGLAFGLAVQTHPIGALMLPGVAIAVALARPRWLLRPWPYLAVITALLGCANLVVANVQSGFAGISNGVAVQEQYTGGEVLTSAVYVERVRQELWLLTDSLSGTLVETGSLSGPLVGSLGLVALAATFAGVESLLRRRALLPLLAAVSFLALLPIVNGRYESSVPKARYIAPLLPICYLAIALLIAESRAWIRTLQVSWARPLRPILHAGVGVLLLVLAIGPLLGLTAYYRTAQQGGLTNALFYQAVRAIQSSTRPGERVYVERQLLQLYTLGGGQWNEHLLFAAAVDNWQRVAFQLPGVLAPSVPRIVGPLVVRGSRAQVAMQLYQTQPIADGPPDGAPVRVFYSSGVQPITAARRGGDLPEAARPASPPRVVPFVSGVPLPSSLAFAPDGRLFFVQILDGTVRIASPQGDLQREPFVTVRATRALEQGIRGLALDPDFAHNHWVYVFYTQADETNRPLRDRLLRFTDVDGQAADATVILDNLPVNTSRSFNGGHNGGRLAFGRDGMLYISIGEMVRRSLVPDPRQVYGKILRINKDGTIPPDNPYGPYMTYALGFRNVYGLAVHPVTGQLYATDPGPRGYDEIDLVLPGRNYGFPMVEGGISGLPDLEDPIWDSDEERLGITGAAFYTGTLFPEYRNNLFFCGFSSGTLQRAVLGGPALDQVEGVETVAGDCRLDVVDGPDGTLYFSDLARIYRLAR